MRQLKTPNVQLLPTINNYLFYQFELDARGF